MWNTWLLALPGGSGLTPNPAILGLLHTQGRIWNPRTCGGNDDGDVDALMVLMRMVNNDSTAYIAGKKHMFAHTYERFEPAHTRTNEYSAWLPSHIFMIR